MSVKDLFKKIKEKPVAPAEIDHTDFDTERAWAVHSDITPKVIEALRFAEEKHAGQLRDDGNPYFKHIEDVVSILGESGSGFEEILVAGALHDTLEDTNATYEEIKDKFGEETADVVKLLTRTKGEKYDDYIKRIIENDVHKYAFMVKMADKLANMRDLPNCGNLDKIKKKVVEAERCFLPVKKCPYLYGEIQNEVTKIKSLFSLTSPKPGGGTDGAR
ncbi:HD domain-containing protein [Treponema sp. R6D11]